MHSIVDEVRNDHRVDLRQLDGCIVGALRRSIIDEQTAYIIAVRDIRQRVRATYKDYPLETIVDMNTASLAGEARSQLRSRDRPSLS
jgi:hypothetical protein